MWNMSVNDNLYWFIQTPLCSCWACLNLQSHMAKWFKTLLPIKQRVVPDTVVPTLRVDVKQFCSRTESRFLAWLSRAIRSECLSAFCLINKSFLTTEEHVSNTNRPLWLDVAHTVSVWREYHLQVLSLTFISTTHTVERLLLSAHYPTTSSKKKWSLDIYCIYTVYVFI